MCSYDLGVIVMGSGGPDDELCIGRDIRRIVADEYFNALASEI